MIARKQFLKLLENIGFLNKAQIDRAIKEHSMGSRSIRSVLLDLKYLGGEESSAALMPQLGLVPTPINITNLPASLVEKVPSNFAREHRVVPLRMDGTTLILATDEPLNILVEENLADNLNVKDVRLEITTTESLNNSLLNAYSLTNEDLRPLLEKVDKGYTGELDMDNPALTVKSGVDGETEEALQAPVIRLANAVIVDALRRRASDIHVEPMEDRFRIRYRIDGVLHENINPPRNLQNPLLARFKIMAGMDLAEKTAAPGRPDHDQCRRTADRSARQLAARHLRGKPGHAYPGQDLDAALHGPAGLSGRRSAEVGGTAQVLGRHRTGNRAHRQR